MLDSSAEHTQNKTPKKDLLLSFIIQKIEGFSTKSYTACDTCDSKKTTSLLEGARIHAYVRTHYARALTRKAWTKMVIYAQYEK